MYPYVKILFTNKEFSKKVMVIPKERHFVSRRLWKCKPVILMRVYAAWLRGCYGGGKTRDSNGSFSGLVGWCLMTYKLDVRKSSQEIKDTNRGQFDKWIHPLIDIYYLLDTLDTLDLLDTLRRRRSIRVNGKSSSNIDFPFCFWTNWFFLKFN